MRYDQPVHNEIGYMCICKFDMYRQNVHRQARILSAVPGGLANILREETPIGQMPEHPTGWLLQQEAVAKGR